MAKLLKLRRGTTSQHSSFTGAEGEVTVDTDKETLVVHDGSTAGGHPVAAEDMANVSSSAIAGRLSNDSLATSKLAAGALPSDVTVASANLVDGTIVNADINASAAIAVTKLGTGALPSTISVNSSNITDNSIVNADVNASASINLSKLEVITSNRIVGNDSGNAVPKELTAAEVRTIINVENGATADQTAAEILTAIKTVDGSGSGLDADTLDGISSASFVRSDQGDTMNGEYTINSGTNEKIILSGSSSPYIRFQEGTTNKGFIQWNSEGFIRLQNQEDSSILDVRDSIRFSPDSGSNFYSVWHAGNDGASSGLDADTVDGLHASSFLRSNTADSADGDISFNGGAGAVTVLGGSDIRLNDGNWTGNNTPAKIQGHSNSLYIVYPDAGSCHIRDSAGNNNFTIDSSGNCTAQGNVTAYSDARLKTDISTINDALGICGKLRGVSYKWIADGKPSIGVIAQEVEEVIPEVVLTNVDTDPETGETTEIKSVDYGKIVGVLINAINELKAEVDELKGGK